MHELQARIVAHIETIAARGVAGAVLVSHAEPIRAALMRYQGVAIDDFHQVEVGPASISILDLASAPAHPPAELGATP
jgi:probable phosphoglycerate mutase